MKSPHPDFLQPAGPIRWRPAALLTTSLLVLAFCGWDAWVARDGLLQARRAAGPASDVADSGLPRSGATPGAESAAARSLREGHAQLQRPWPQWFASIESVDVAGVAWLALDFDESGRLRLDGAGPDPAAGLQAAEALRRNPIWREVIVGRMTAASDKQPARFELLAEPAGIVQ